MAPSAPEYESSLIRNIAVVGHGGAGKTTLIDAMAYIGGTTRRRGQVERGNGGWTIGTPVRDAADAQTVSRLLSSLLLSPVLRGRRGKTRS